MNIVLCGMMGVGKSSVGVRIAASLNKRTVNGAAMLFYQAYYADCIYLRRGTDAAEAKTLWDEYRGGKV